jgi:hypothetical protein
MGMLHARDTSEISIRARFARYHRYAAGVAIYAGKVRKFAVEENRLVGGPVAGIWVPPCRNDGVPCKELAMALPEYDSERSVIPAWRRWQKEGKQ